MPSHLSLFFCRRPPLTPHNPGPLPRPSPPQPQNEVLAALKVISEKKLADSGPGKFYNIDPEITKVYARVKNDTDAKYNAQGKKVVDFLTNSIKNTKTIVIDTKYPNKVRRKRVGRESVGGRCVCLSFSQPHTRTFSPQNSHPPPFPTHPLASDRPHVPGARRRGRPEGQPGEPHDREEELRRKCGACCVSSGSPPFFFSEKCEGVERGRERESLRRPAMV